jgi:hypothetical protein
MIEKSYEHYGYLIEIHQHPIYKDFEFVIKTLDSMKVVAASTQTYDYSEDAERDAQLMINYL